MENWRVVSDNNEPVKLGVYRIYEHAMLPTFATDGSACFDVYASLPDDSTVKVYSSNFQDYAKVPVRSDCITIYNGHRAMIPTGIIFDIPQGYSVRLHARSGLALNHGITILNSPGTIDSDYRGEVKVILINHFSKIFVIKPNMRIGQIVFSPIVKIQLEFGRVNILETERSSKGFGSTGLE